MRRNSVTRRWRLVTDYDCWHETEEAVTVEAVLGTLHRNVDLAKQILRAAMPTFINPLSAPVIAH